MDIAEAMACRHAVRDYSDRPVAPDTLARLGEAVAQANRDGDLHIQLVGDGGNGTDAFGGCPTHYGRFRNVRHCIALIGRDDDNADAGDLDERVGYYGERLALTATMLGLDTSWVVLHEPDRHDGAWLIGDGERMPAAIAVGYGTRPGRPHRSKPIDQLGSTEHGGLDDAPDWFIMGLEAAALAPSALGKQPVHFTLLDDGTVRAEALDGVQSEICLGIARLHFEVGAGGLCRFC
ncbi:nitroreductase family protein [Bifidobacterium leontopitheci]|uniref:Nitroreductase n=1 Tax=Bifidobacterium leontopitheci TaxID=2650774 RepID=A0A6I1GS20_9BIFI|nr:nitroreductase family protein [Bifidobacterium leontopitheci]KAB7790968.1 nitroreductase [Bifidobacterium leontopitheci]